MGQFDAKREAERSVQRRAAAREASPADRRFPEI